MSLPATAPPLLAAPDPAAVMAQARHENFPVASRLLGARERDDLMAIYGFARLVDDIGDVAEGDRGALLDWAEQEVARLYAGESEHPIMRALAPTVSRCAIPPDPLLRLIQANRRDQVVSSYRDFDELLAYCQLSAAPVGELVLYVFDRATPDRIALSDRVCAGLQVVEHLQDVAEDRARGRTYFPREDLARFDCPESDLDAARPSLAFEAAMAFEAQRARELLDAGVPLMRRLPLRPALAVAGFVAGGRAALDALARGDYDVLGGRPRPSRAAFALRWLRTARERKSSR